MEPVQGFHGRSAEDHFICCDSALDPSVLMCVATELSVSSSWASAASSFSWLFSSHLTEYSLHPIFLQAAHAASSKF